ncbi:DUF3576 domain-containing protein [uncultured Thalassospira sp.]|tara:strand:- start:613 stop:1335 length:723 start_codon:yes stop_codon:yes gene_type:complete
MEPAFVRPVNHSVIKMRHLFRNVAQKPHMFLFAVWPNRLIVRSRITKAFLKKVRNVQTYLAKSLGILFILTVVSGCAGKSDHANMPGSAPGDQRVNGRSATVNDIREQGSLFGSDGLSIFGGEEKQEGSGSGIGVNSFLWRATLDTLSFMPLNSADPFGGVIITDWYTPPESSDERFKLTAYILGTALRSDAIKVSVFRQVNVGPNQWQDAVVEPGTVTSMEDAILTRARQLRIDSANSQ